MIYIDYDSTLNDMSHKWLDWLNDTYSTDFKQADVTHWDWYSDLSNDKSNQIKPYKWFSDRIVYNSIYEHGCRPLEGAVDFMEYLRKLGLDVTILTTTSDNMKDFKEQHIREYFGDVKIIHSSNKEDYAIPNAILVDDKLETCEAFAEAGGVALVYNHNDEYCYNIPTTPKFNVLHVSSYTRILELINILKGTYEHLRY